MKQLKSSLSLQLVFAIVGALAILFAVVSAFLVSGESDRTRKQIDADLSALVQLKSNEVTNYFVAKAKVIDAVFSSPQVLDWFSQYDTRLSNLDHDTQYQRVIQYFKHFSKTDSDIKSVFFGSANTFEYFDLNGRYNDADYYTNKRPWWQEGINKNGMYVTDPAVDANDGSISATVKSVINNANGEFIGIGGMDILIDTIGTELLASMKYQGQGQAFLVTQSGQLVYFPGFTEQFQPGSQAGKADSYFNDTQGFAQLSRVMNGNNQGVAEVTFKGVKQRVSYISVGGNFPQQQWHLAFMLPNDVIEAPVNEAMMNATLLATMIMLLVGATVWMMLLPFRRQINRLLEAMEDIAQGDSDLSKRIHMDRDDELGKLGDAFNRFAAKVQGMLEQTRELTQRVNSGVNGAVSICDKALHSVSQQKQEISSVATAATEMAHTSQEMANSAQRASDFAEKAQQESQEGMDIVAKATDGMQSLSTQVIEAAKVVRHLRTSSEQIGEVLSVIRGIAEQTNLLALNAAIEAARAGEQGRGFAVVADEVRTLASRTQDSTANIQEIIQTLQQNALQAEQVMEEGVNQANAGQELTIQVETALTSITGAISAIQQQTIEITSAIGQQAVVAEEIACNVENVRGLSDDSLASSEALSSSLTEFQQVTEALSKNIQQFKV
ncbi:methyl-accepting chemotaxis protein [Shewanella eurypsychrophilus]|uniref:Methyl-accepting chemotaxis protein n=1 Tax=Shewanella eurypsychrophilus TaxID=2593656 RepID=A0ABX6V4W6_9GAMM|nr:MULTISPECIES: methyl-accepting chemotaxis protein [Shewanella]QFU21724.1 HAMP domain-containing protein [Shewanella sp. YLB-09]QPG57015.1 methyl-accepting chemotaxis protein [Shewanella eurypsychrophilus]